MRTRSRVVVAASGLVVLGASLLVGAARDVLAEPSSLNGLSAMSTVDADPFATWFGQVNRDGICALLPGCVVATGAGRNWTYGVDIAVPGAGVQRVPVDVRVVQETPGQLVRLTMVSQSAVAGVSADVVLRLQPHGSGTALSLSIASATTSGLADAFVPQFIEQFGPTVVDQTAALNQSRAAAEVRMTLSLTTSGPRVRATVRLAAVTLAAASPRASGVVRMMAGMRTLCVARISANSGSCTFARPTRPTTIRAVATGQFDNGYPVWQSATAVTRR